MRRKWMTRYDDEQKHPKKTKQTKIKKKKKWEEFVFVDSNFFAFVTRRLERYIDGLLETV